jgi:hypothetical protein
MRSRATWQRIVVVTSVALNLAFLNRDVFHRPFGPSFVVGLAVFGVPVLINHLGDRKQGQQSAATDQPSTIADGDDREQNASGG